MTDNITTLPDPRHSEVCSIRSGGSVLTVTMFYRSPPQRDPMVLDDNGRPDLSSLTPQQCLIELFDPEGNAQELRFDGAHLHRLRQILSRFDDPLTFHR